MLYANCGEVQYAAKVCYLLPACALDVQVVTNQLNTTVDPGTLQ